ncbi:SpoIIE family protein phosphatase [bacterium]|nr:SpoIIE family protein phosphatase [bacterium]
MNNAQARETIQTLLKEAQNVLVAQQYDRLASIVDQLEKQMDSFDLDGRPLRADPVKMSHLESLINAARILNSTLDLEELLTLFMDLATREMKADRSTLYLVDTKKQELWSLIAQGPNMVEIRLPFGRGIAGKVAVTGETININDPYNDPRFYKEIDLKMGYTTRNMLSMPVRNKEGEIIGVIQILNKLDGPFTQEDEFFLENLAIQTAVAIENAKLHKEALERRRLEAELRVAYQIQKNMLPQESPAVEGLTLCGLNVPCLEVGGDYFDFIPLEDGLAIAIGDVSGKGIPAALIMANLQAALRVLAPTSRSTAHTVLRMNTLLKESSTPNKFVTFFYCIYNYRDRKLTFTNAGHNPPILVRRGQPGFLPTNEGLIMGAFHDAIYQENTIELHDDDVIVLYTDGITEACNRSKEHYGEHRLLELIEMHWKQSATDIQQAIVQSVADFSHSTSPNDDMTLIVMKMQRS